MPTPEAPLNNFKDHYSTLGLNGRDPNFVTPKMIQRQYRLLARTIHPDRFYVREDKLKADAKMKSLNEAYEVLQDPIKKSEYDRDYVNWRITHPAQAGNVRFLEQLEILPDVLKDLFKDLIKAKRLNINFASIEKYNVKTLDELHAIEELVEVYQGDLVKLYQLEIDKFKETIRAKEKYGLPLWSFMRALKDRSFVGLNNRLVFEAKREWNVYKVVFSTEFEFEQNMDTALEIILDEFIRNPWTNRGTIIGFDEMLDRMH